MGGAVGAKVFRLQGIRPYLLRNVWNPGPNTIRLYGQAIAGGAIALIPSLFGTAPAYGEMLC
jgi:hypothetical protein